MTVRYRGSGSQLLLNRWRFLYNNDWDPYTRIPSRESCLNLIEV